MLEAIHKLPLPLARPWLAAALAALAAFAAQAAGVEPIAGIAAAASQEALRVAQGSGVQVSEARVDPRLRVARCTAPLIAAAAPGSRAGGRLTVEVGCDAPRWRVYVPVSLTANMPIAVAARPLPARATLAPGDLRLAERDVHKLPGGYFARLEDAYGMELTRALGAGEPLEPRAARAGSLVRRGQEVTLLARGDGITVRMKGEALANGGRNQRIRVRNLSSGREVEGVVRSADLVEVAM
jgi:flagella basal body P-ring formation protein FlgA